VTEDLLDRALGELVPAGPEDGDWEEVLVRAAKRPERRMRRRTALLALAAALLLALAAVVVAAVVTRTNILFSHARPAPNLIKKEFFDLAIGAPSGLAPNVLAAKTRQVPGFHLGGRSITLSVAPTSSGGFCYQFSEGAAGGGCAAVASQRAAQQLGVSFGLKINPRGVPSVNQVGGWTLDARATHIRVDYRDGTSETVSLIYVSAPIAAGFFVFAVPRAHLNPAAALTAVSALDKDGHVLERELPANPRRFPPLRLPRGPTQPQLAPPTPPPMRPLQRGAVDGVTVAVGTNGVAVFDTRRMTPHARSLVGAVSFGCFRLAREFGIFGPRALDISVRMAPIVRLQFSGVGTPFDGCQLTGDWGHRWPDRNHSHAPVEIALTPGGRRFFADRATARDLGLFVRSPNVRKIRAESGRRLRDDLSRYPIRTLGSATARFSPGQLGYFPTLNGVTFVEWSPIGKRFFVQVSRGKIKRSNLEPYGWAF
jgi:hypothetical protein